MGGSNGTTYGTERRKKPDAKFLTQIFEFKNK